VRKEYTARTAATTATVKMAKKSASCVFNDRHVAHDGMLRNGRPAHLHKRSIRRSPSATLRAQASHA
jgi:hypothetical protein